VKTLLTNSIDQNGHCPQDSIHKTVISKKFEIYSNSIEIFGLKNFQEEGLFMKYNTLSVQAQQNKL